MRETLGVEIGGKKVDRVRGKDFDKFLKKKISFVKKMFKSFEKKNYNVNKFVL